MSKRRASSRNGAFLGFIAVLAVAGAAITFFKDNWPYVVAFRSLDEIRRSGYTPCGYCKP